VKRGWPYWNRNTCFNLIDQRR